ncbi:MAG: protein kinase [Alphaproteobacteria bacterium]|nr:protein kinase [Alphaproteobacteria bacterium]
MADNNEDNDPFGAVSEATVVRTVPPAQQATSMRPRQQTGGDMFSGGPTAGGPLAPGTVLSSTFEIEELVARGGMGEVYRARHRITGDAIAIKTIRPELAGDPKVAELFKREAQALRNLRHPAIVSYEGVFDDGTGSLFLAMEFVDGPSLSKVLHAGPVPPAELARLRDRLAGGLAAAHAQGVVHRDLSPDNVILPGGRIDDAKLIDFGIAKQTEGSKATIIGTDFAGKYAFAAPEQLGMHGGDVGPRADIYSLGLVLAAAGLGGPIDMGNSPGTAVQARLKVPDIAKVPAELRASLTRMLQPDPAQRPASMADLISPANTRRTPTSQAKTSGGGNKGVMIAAASVLVLLIAVGGGVFAFRDKLFGDQPADPKTGDPKVAGDPKAGDPKAGDPKAGDPKAGEPKIAAADPKPPVADPKPPVADPKPPVADPKAADPKPPVADPKPPVADPKPPVTEPKVAAAVDAARMRQLMDAEFAKYSCAGLSGRVDPDGSLRVDGYVGSESDRTAVLNNLRQLPGNPLVQTRISVQPWPMCELNRIAGSVANPAFRLIPNKPDQAYKIGVDRLSFKVTAPPGRSGVLNVVIINSDGTVAQPGIWSKMPIKPGEAISFGDKEAGGGFSLDPPPGKMVLIAVFTSQPLYSAARPEEEATASYLTALSGALSRHSDAIVSFVAIDTVN